MKKRTGASPTVKPKSHCDTRRNLDSVRALQRYKPIMKAGAAARMSRRVSTDIASRNPLSRNREIRGIRGPVVSTVNALKSSSADRAYVITTVSHARVKAEVANRNSPTSAKLRFLNVRAAYT